MRRRRRLRRMSCCYPCNRPATYVGQTTGKKKRKKKVLKKKLKRNNGRFGNAVAELTSMSFPAKMKLFETKTQKREKIC